MRIRIYSAATRYWNSELPQKYIDILKMYDLEEETYQNEWEDEIKYKYYIYLDTITQLFDMSKLLKHDLVIEEFQGERNIIIYDDYIE